MKVKDLRALLKDSRFDDEGYVLLQSVEDGVVEFDHLTNTEHEPPDGDLILTIS